MPTPIPVIFNSTTPAAPAGKQNVTWQQDSNGNLSAYVPTAGGGAASIATVRRTAYVTAGMDGTQSAGGVVGGSLGTDVGTMGGSQVEHYSPSATVGNSLRFATSTPNYLCGLLNSISFTHAMGQNLGYLCIANVGQLTDIRMWIGLCDNQSPESGLGSNDTPSEAGFNFIGFRLSSNASDTDWQCVTSNGTSSTVTSSGVAADTNSHRFAFAVEDSVPNVTFYIDGNAVATIATNLPASGTTLTWLFGSTYLTSGPSYFYFSQLRIDSDF